MDMDKEKVIEKVIETLKDLKDYVNENWEPTEYEEDIKNANQALDIAIAISKVSGFSGILTLGNKRYIVLEAPEE